MGKIREKTAGQLAFPSCFLYSRDKKRTPALPIGRCYRVRGWSRRKQRTLLYFHLYLRPMGPLRRHRRQSRHSKLSRKRKLPNGPRLQSNCVNFALSSRHLTRHITCSLKLLVSSWTELRNFPKFQRSAFLAPMFFCYLPHLLLVFEWDCELRPRICF
jgi:hypothetical protein